MRKSSNPHMKGHVVYWQWVLKYCGVWIMIVVGYTKEDGVVGGQVGITICMVISFLVS